MHDCKVQPLGLDAAGDACGAETVRGRNASFDRGIDVAHLRGDQVQPLDVEASAADCAAAMDDRRGLFRPNQGAVTERQRHRVLAASTELGARTAITLDFLRYPDVRHDRETEAHEVGGLVSKCAERREAMAGAVRGEMRHEPRANVLPARMFGHDKRPHFSHVSAERRQLGATDDGTIRFGDGEPRDVRGDVIERTGKQVARLEVVDDQPVNVRGVIEARPAGTPPVPPVLNRVEPC